MRWDGLISDIFWIGYDTAFLMINCEIIARNVAWWDLLEHLRNLNFPFLSDHRYAPHLMPWKTENLSPQQYINCDQLTNSFGHVKYFELEKCELPWLTWTLHSHETLISFCLHWCFGLRFTNDRLVDDNLNARRLPLYFDGISKILIDTVGCLTNLSVSM